MSLRAQAHVDGGAIERNARTLRGRCGPRVTLCAVVKADAYGHGAVAVARAALAGGARWLAVATAAEAVELRHAGLREPILVLGPLDEVDLELAVACDADVVAWSAAFVGRVAAHTAGHGTRVHVKLDTGMGRLGTRTAARALDLCDEVAGEDRLRLVGAMTHFATADDPRDGYFARQLADFGAFARAVRTAERRILIHAANSAATLSEPAAHFDMVRCGIALFGLDPFQVDPRPWNLEPALELRSYVARVARVSAGETVGYGRRYVAPAATEIATVPIGYADGIRRSAGSTLEVLVAGRRRRVAGAISMDSLAIDLGPITDVAVGGEVVLIGSQGSERILVEELARAQGTINYEIVCALGRRVRRSYYATA